MAFEKGQQKKGGRQAGTPNKVANDLRTKITSFLNGEFEQVKEDYQQLAPKDKLKFYTDLMQYGVPKLAATTLDIDFDSLSEADLDNIINRLLQAGK